MRTTIVIFGASGDLTNRKLVPALYNLYRKNRLPEQFNIVGISRRPIPHDDFRDKMRNGVKEFSPMTFNTIKWDEFAPHLWYLSADSTKLEDYQAVDEFLKDLENNEDSNRLYYLSTAPSLYEPTAHNLAKADMVGENGGWRHLVVEKPFGTDLDSAQALNASLHEVFAEHQIYRIDHYLGKETAQNIMFFRFANTIFEPIWNRNYIENIQITVAEKVDVGHRAAYYDDSGVVRDMFQNHLFQLLTLVASEPPASFEANALRNEKVKLLQSIKPIQLSDTVRAQYDGYLDIDGVEENSQTPTYAALKLHINNWRWEGVPFYLRSGKLMTTKTSQINIEFKGPPSLMFDLPEGSEIVSNVLTMCIQPDEGIGIQFEAKMPDTNETRSVKMQFDYASSFGECTIPEAYERLIYDALKGDAALFTRSDGIESAWSLVDPVIEGWVSSPEAPPMVNYEHGSWGPTEADELLARDGHQWINGCGVK